MTCKAFGAIEKKEEKKRGSKEESGPGNRPRPALKEGKGGVHLLQGRRKKEKAN